MNKQDLISRLDDGIAALRDLASRPYHSDRMIRIGAKFYTRGHLEHMTAAMEEVSTDVGDETEPVNPATPNDCPRCGGGSCRCDIASNN